MLTFVCVRECVHFTKQNMFSFLAELMYLALARQMGFFNKQILWN